MKEKKINKIHINSDKGVENWELIPSAVNFVRRNNYTQIVRDGEIAISMVIINQSSWSVH